MKLKDFKGLLNEELKDPENALLYLQDAIDERDVPGLLLALRDVIEAQGGIADVAKKSSLHRVSLYKALSTAGNPLFSTVISVLDSLNIGLQLCSKSTLRRADRR